MFVCFPRTIKPINQFPLNNCRKNLNPLTFIPLDTQPRSYSIHICFSLQSSPSFPCIFSLTSLEIIFHKLREKQPTKNAKHGIRAHKYGLPIFKPTVKTLTTGSSSISLILCNSRMENSPARTSDYHQGDWQ